MRGETDLMPSHAVCQTGPKLAPPADLEHELEVRAVPSGEPDQMWIPVEPVGQEPAGSVTGAGAPRCASLGLCRPSPWPLSRLHQYSKPKTSNTAPSCDVPDSGGGGGGGPVSRTRSWIGKLSPFGLV